MERKRIMSWKTQLEIAIIEKDSEKLSKVLDETPKKFKDNDEIRSVMYLLKQAAEFMYELRDETAISMAKLKKNIEFIESMHRPKKSTRLDTKL